MIVVRGALQHRERARGVEKGAEKMVVRTVELDRDYVFSHCTKYLARNYRRVLPRHNYNNYPEGDQRACIAEAWRFPVIDALSDAADPRACASNSVTFVYFDALGTPPGAISVIGTFANLYQPIPLQRVGTSPYFAVTVVVPKGEVHT